MGIPEKSIHLYSCYSLLFVNVMILKYPNATLCKLHIYVFFLAQIIYLFCDNTLVKSISLMKIKPE